MARPEGHAQGSMCEVPRYFAQLTRQYPPASAVSRILNIALSPAAPVGSREGGTIQTSLWAAGEQEIHLEPHTGRGPALDSPTVRNATEQVEAPAGIQVRGLRRDGDIEARARVTDLCAQGLGLDLDDQVNGIARTEATVAQAVGHQFGDEQPEVVEIRSGNVGSQFAEGHASLPGSLGTGR